MYAGRFQLGDELCFTISTVNSSDVPTAPTAAPTLDLWLNGTSKLYTTRMAPVDRDKITGVFSANVMFGAEFSTGLYFAVARYAISGTTYTAIFSLQLVAGGNADGPVVATREFRRANGNFIVQVLRSGRIKYGRNPQIA